MRTLGIVLATLLGFAIGASATDARATRERAALQIAHERDMGDMRAKVECAYHEGSDEGYRNGISEGRKDRARLLVRDNPDGSQEITIDDHPGKVRP